MSLSIGDIGRQGVLCSWQPLDIDATFIVSLRKRNNVTSALEWGKYIQNYRFGERYRQIYGWIMFNGWADVLGKTKFPTVYPIIY